VSWNSATSGAVAAVAENHNVMPRNMANDSHASCHGALTAFDDDDVCMAVGVYRIRC
jgi:hypothetical protein